MLAACGGGEGGSSTGQAPSGSASGSAQSAPLRIAFIPATTALALQVANAQGFFQANNLEVTLTKAANISDLPNTLGRQFDLALGTATDLIRAGAAGLDVVQVSGNTVSTKANPFVQVVVPPTRGSRTSATWAARLSAPRR